MQKMLESGIVPKRGGVCIDLYNQQIHDEAFVSITTRIDQCNHYWITTEE